MSASQPTRCDVPNPRARTITTILMIMLVFMIVRDVFARRRNRFAPAVPRRDISLVVR
jgi:hypothetical protein